MRSESIPSMKLASHLAKTLSCKNCGELRAQTQEVQEIYPTNTRRPLRKRAPPEIINLIIRQEGF